MFRNHCTGIMEQKPGQITDENNLSYKIAKHVLTAGSYCCGDCREFLEHFEDNMTMCAVITL
jgi:hypothetical protein